MTILKQTLPITTLLAVLMNAALLITEFAY
jgi:hypothetical protein